MANETPRQRGLVSELYAVQKAAEQLGDPKMVAYVAELRQAITDPAWWQWLTPVEYYRGRIEDLAAVQAERLGYNPLDVPDTVGVGTVEQEAVVGGDPAAQLSALGSDFAESARERGEELAKAADITWKVALAVLIVGALVYAYARGARA